MNISIEFERKFMLSHAQYEAYCSLLSLKILPSVTLQMNYYYDNSEFVLFERYETLRVRQKGENLTIEYKHSKRQYGDVRKSEENATAIFAFPGRIILGSIEAIMIGCLLTERTDFLFGDIKVSLDKSVYLGIVDYELEIETNGTDELPQFLTAITENATRSTIGKYRRFVSRLKKMDTRYEI